jgi:hypothetical protein
LFVSTRFHYVDQFDLKIEILSILSSQEPDNTLGCTYFFKKISPESLQQSEALLIMGFVRPGPLTFVMSRSIFTTFSLLAPVPSRKGRPSELLQEVMQGVTMKALLVGGMGWQATHVWSGHYEMLKLTLKIHSRLGWGSSGKYKRP